MDPAFTTMLDVIRIVTFQSRDARTRHITLERRPTNVTAGDELESTAVHATKPRAWQFRKWFRLSLIPR